MSGEDDLLVVIIDDKACETKDSSIVSANILFRNVANF